MTNNDMEAFLGQLTPRGVRPELRPQVLAAVASQLKAEPVSPWLRRSALAMAASILVGIAMNTGASVMAERRLAQINGPPPVSKRAMELAKAIEEITDPQTARWACGPFVSPQRSGDGRAAYLAYCDMLQRLIDEHSITSKGPFDEAPQNDVQMDRDHPGRAIGDRTDYQRHLRLDHRFSA